MMSSPTRRGSACRARRSSLPCARPAAPRARTSRAAATTPSASTSQRRMPPKMLMKMAFTARVGEEDPEGRARPSPRRRRRRRRGSWPARRPRALTMSMVAIARPAPFTMQPMLPLERDVAEIELRRLDARAGPPRVGSRSSRSVGVAEERVVVEAHLGVEREEIAACGHHQRVDLDERAVALDEGARQRRRGTRPPCRRCSFGEPERRTRGAAPGTPPSPTTGSSVSRRIFSGVFAATSSISTPPSVDAITVTAPAAAVDDHAEVELARDVAALLDEQPAHDAPLRARSGA